MPLWSYLEGGGKRAIEIAHRRWGKDDVLLHFTACAANGRSACKYSRIGTYWHMLPSYKQARKAIWEAVNPRTGKRRIDEAFPSQIIQDKRETDMFIRFHCGSTWQVVGSDNFNSLVGSPPVGVTGSEWALSDPLAWSFLSPALNENKGWAAFVTTPRGRNHAHKMYEHAVKNPFWYARLHSAADTPVFDASQLEEIRQECIDLWGEDDGDSVFRQEYLCSFDASLVGTYYARIIEKLDAQGRLVADGIEHEPGYPVETAWDIGYSDDTAIWWFQIIRGELRVLKYYANRFKDMAHYAEVITQAANERGWRYFDTDPHQANHWVPWDARPKTLASGGKSLLEIAWGDHQLQLKVVKNISTQDGIQNVYRALKTAWFDAPDCEAGLEALRAYRRIWDEDRKMFCDEAYHDWTSHGADAFRMLAIAAAERLPFGADKKPGKIDRSLDVQEATFADLMKFNTQMRREHRI